MKKRSVLYNYFLKNEKIFLILFIMFIIGICIGIFFINNADTAKKEKIEEYMSKLILNIKNYNSVNKTELLIKSIKKNISLILLIWILGCSIIGSILIYAVIVYKGLSLGYTLSSTVAYLGAKNGIIFIIFGILMQNALLIFSIFILSESGIRIFKDLKIKPIKIGKEFIRYTIIMLFSLIIAIFSSFIEVYVSTNLLMWVSKFF